MNDKINMIIALLAPVLLVGVPQLQ